MTKSSLNRMLDLDAEKISETVADDEQLGSSKEPLALTLDERSNLFLNAVYGSRSFTSNEYSRARNTLLDAMASQFAKDQDDPGFPVVGTGDNILSRPPMMRSADNRDIQFSVARTSLETLSTHSSIPTLREGKSMSSQPRRHEFPVSEESASDRNYQPTKRISAGEKNWGRRLLMFGAIAAILSFVIVPSGILYLLFHSSKPNHTFADSSLERFNEVQQQGRKVETLQSRRQASGSNISQRLLELGHKLIASGDILGGRQVLSEAVDEGSGAAAYDLGSSFDPNEQASSEKGISNLEMARFWYGRARQLGNLEAQARLDRLDRR
jgi:hypothetical protein